MEVSKTKQDLNERVAELEVLVKAQEEKIKYLEEKEKISSKNKCWIENNDKMHNLFLKAQQELLNWSPFSLEEIKSLFFRDKYKKNSSGELIYYSNEKRKYIMDIMRIYFQRMGYTPSVDEFGLLIGIKKNVKFDWYSNPKWIQFHTKILVARYFSLSDPQQYVLIQ